MSDPRSLALLFERLLEAFSRPWDSEQARRVDSATSDPTRPWPEALGRVAQTVGVNLTPLRASCSEMVGLVGQRHPAITLSADQGRWWLLLDRDGDRALVVTALATEGTWMGPDALAAAIGADSPRAPVQWCTADLTEPMAELAHPASAFSRVWALARLEREDLKVVLLYAMATGLFSLVTPIAVQSLVNTTAFGSVLQPLLVLTVVVVVALGLSAVLSSLQLFVVEVIQRRLFVKVVGDLAHRLPRLQPGAFGQHYGPEQVNRFFDVITVQKSAATVLVDGLGLVLTATVGLVLLAFYHPWLLAFDLALIFALGLILFGLGRGAVTTAIDESKKKYAVAAWLEELARQHDLFRGSGGRTIALERADRLAREYLYARANHFAVVLRQTAAAYGLQAIASGALLGLGGLLVFEGQLTLGQLVAAELIVTSIVGAFTKMGKQLDAYYDLTAAAEKLGHLFELKMVGLHGETPPSPPPGGSTLRISGLALAMGDGKLLDGLSLELRSGERVLLRGRSGSGKTLLCEAISGRRSLAAGHLELDGLDLRDLDPSEHHRRVLLLRPGEIFHGSLLDNVRLGDHRIETAHVREALDRVGVLDAALLLPDGIQTELLPSGAPFSSAQVASVIVARALVHRPSLLVADGILDELDDVTRLTMTELLADKNAPWTLLVTSRRPEIPNALNRTLSFTDGKLLEVTS